jgi:triacylglycerol esterase/lipase EstA (alpha/beta hydrolase family)
MVVPGAVRVGATLPPSGGTSVPILFVHGWNPFESAGYSCRIYWGRLEAALRSLGWRGPLVDLKYQALDTQCDATIDDDGSHNADHGNDHRISPHYNHSLIDPNAHSSQTPIEHLGYHLAWYVYDHYSKRGRPVYLVGHSMGGLVIRSMLTQFQEGSAAFPPKLVVPRVLTLSSPHNGSPKARSCVPRIAVQCAEMAPGSPFLRHLADAPQGTAGTRWTLMGSAHDELVMSGATLRILYDHPRYDHFTILWDERTAEGATWRESDRGGPWKTHHSEPYSCHEVFLALADPPRG